MGKDPVFRRRFCLFLNPSHPCQSVLSHQFLNRFSDGFLIRDPHGIIFLRTDGNEAFILRG